MKHGPSLAFRLTVYPLVLLMFVVICAFVVFSAAGYNIKFENGRIVTEKTGMVIVATRPGEAVVALDGEVQKQKTPSLPIFNLKIKRVISGSHHLTVSKEGYETWEGDINVKPGLVSWRDYLVLVPLSRKTEAYNIPGSIEGQVTSKDHRRTILFAADRTQNIYSFWQISLENKTSVKIREGSLAPDEKIELVSVSNDSEKFLYKKTDPATKKTAYIVSETKENGQLYNIGDLFSGQAEGYYFSPFHSNELYFTQQGSLYKINLENRTESAVIVKDVVGVHPVDGQLLLTRKVEENYGLWSLGNNNEATNIIKSLPAAESYQVSYLKGLKSYLVQDSTDKDLLLYNSVSRNPTLEIIARNIGSFAVSPQGYTVAIYSAEGLRVYDIPEGKYYTTMASDQITSYCWMQDGKNIIYGTKDSISLVNFNGDYNKILFKVSATPSVVTSYDNHNLLFTDTIDSDKDIYSFSF